jgi:plasmid rolling circle replication initiator protein Rep
MLELQHDVSCVDRRCLATCCCEQFSFCALHDHRTERSSQLTQVKFRALAGPLLSRMPRAAGAEKVDSS